MSKLAFLLPISLLLTLLARAPDLGAGGTPPPDGTALYERFCTACHGSFGDGQGPAMPYLWPRPRDFTTGEYKWRSTRGAPTDADLDATIRYGIADTSMHPFAATLTDDEIAALITTVKGFCPDAFEDPEPVVPIGAPPVIDDALRARGAEVWKVACLSCHGESGRGDGPSAATLADPDGLPTPPFDLTTRPLRRPRPTIDQPDRDPGLLVVYTELVTGIPGSGMPAYVDIPDRDLWAVSAFTDALRWRPGRPGGAVDPARINQLSVDLDSSKIGYWPGHGSPDDESVLGTTLRFQGPPPASLGPAEASLDVDRCARCHAAQQRDWQQSFHSLAASPGLYGQVSRLRDPRPARLESCQRCHAPLPEQLPVIRPGHLGGDDLDATYRPNPDLEPTIRAQGVGCPTCHLRGWRRLGPPPATDSRLLSLPGYPFTATTLYQRSDFCLPCHQLTPTSSVNGKPLLNTYVEWLQGPYMRRGVQCQHCHMPNREHTWKGVHDPATFRQAIALDAIAARSKPTGAVSVRARLRNVGAGHDLPTTATPAVYLKIELLDDGGRPILGAVAEKRISRGATYDYEQKKFVDDDTRIPPGEQVELAAAWKKGRVAEATTARVSVRVVPDDYYTKLYRRRLTREKLSPEARAYFEAALARSSKSEYVALERMIPL